MIGRRGPRQLQILVAEQPAPDTRWRRLFEGISAVVDWSPIYELAASSFAERGRPSLDPVLMVKMMLVGYLLGIESDRMLVEECADRSSVREFLGLEEGESVPAHSSFTEWRHRLGSEFFREVLHKILEQCVAHGVLLSRARTVDGTSVKAQASVHGPVVWVPKSRDVEEYLQAVEAGEEAALPGRGAMAVNTHDDEARLQRKRDESADYRYKASFCADAETGFITDATATAFESPKTAVEHIDEDPYEVTELVADALYDHGETLQALQDRGVTPYVPDRERNPTKLLSSAEFTYDAEADQYICPQGHCLPHSRYRADKQLHYYVARISSCKACPRKAQCTEAQRRTVTRSVHASALERTVRKGTRYRYLMGRRRVNEHLNNMGKRDHCLRRARALGLDAMRIQAALTAVAINLNKLLRWLGSSKVVGQVAVLAAPARGVGGARTALTAVGEGLGAAVGSLRGSGGLQRAAGATGEGLEAAPGGLKGGPWAFVGALWLYLRNNAGRGPALSWRAPVRRGF